MNLTYTNWAEISNETLEKTVVSLLIKERTVLVELLVNLNIVFRRKLYAMRGYSSLNDYLIARFGMSKQQAWTRATLARIVDDHPQLLSMLEKGESCLSRLAMIASRLTPANSAILYNAACCMSKRELEAFLPRVTNNGEILPGDDLITLTIKCSRECAELFDHAAALARNGQSGALTQGDVLTILLETYIEKRDPQRKAARAEMRRKRSVASAEKSIQKLKKNFDHRRAHPQAVETYEPRLQEKERLPETAGKTEQTSGRVESEKMSPESVDSKVPETKGVDKVASGKKYERIPIPAAVRHHVILRDGGRCSWVSPDGRKCDSRRHLQIDHVDMVCRGGGNDILNLRTLCKTHNEFEMERQLGIRRDRDVSIFPGIRQSGRTAPIQFSAEG